LNLPKWWEILVDYQNIYNPYEIQQNTNNL
jgi:hypothetical protein